MADPRFGVLGGVGNAVTRFVLDDLEAKFMGTEAPAQLNLVVEFSRFLRGHGLAGPFAEEVASQQSSFVRMRLAQQMGRWTDQGVPAPFAFPYGVEEVVVSWRHHEFLDHGGTRWASDGYVDVYDWVGQQNGRDFLLPCLCFLKTIGCDPIYVTDSSRDEGIDCIGLVSAGGLRSTIVFVQAKSTCEPVAGDLVLQEYGKYSGLPRTGTYLQYLNALGVGSLKDGAAPIYAVLANGDFRFAAQQGAARLGVLLRSRRQLAHAISASFSVERLAQLKAAARIPGGRDLTLNLAPILTPG